MKQYIKKMAAAGIAAAFWAAQAVPVFAMDPILPHDQVKEGMTGTAYTVIDSTGLRRNFQVDIVGTMDNGKGSDPMIMAKASGPVIEETGGILQGMSGSPVYVDGRLVGAVAAGIKEMTPYTFFITPIDVMTPLWSLPDRKNKTQLQTVDIKKAALDEELAKTAEDIKLAEHKADHDKVYGDELVDRAAKAVAADKKAAKKAKAEAAAETKKAILADAEDKDATAKASDSSDEETAEDTASADTDEVADADATKDDEAAAAKATVKEAAGDVEAKADSAKADKAKAHKAQKEDKTAKENKENKDVMYFAGFNQQSLDYLKRELDPQGSTQFLPMGNSGMGSQTQTNYHATLNPGDAVGVAITYGDFAVGATGTVTATDGKKILAFGHPFLHRGNVNYFMTDAQVVGTISGQSNGMKIANIGNIIGRINQDRATGIAGTLGQFPSVVPIRVRVNDATLARHDDFGASIAYDEDLLPQLSGGIAYAALSKTADDLSGSTAKVSFQIRTDAIKGGVVKRTNMFYNTADVGQIAMAELIQAMNAICENSDRESNIVDVQVNIDVDNDRKTASIISAVPDKTEVKPGETVKFTTTIKPYRKSKETVLIPFKVPENQPEGQMILDVRGGGLVPASTLVVLQQAGVDVSSSASSSQTTEEKLKNLQESGCNNEIIIAPSVTKASLTRASKAKWEPEEQNEHKVDLLEQNKDTAGQTKFATNYIIDNVVHSVLKVSRK